MNSNLPLELTNDIDSLATELWEKGSSRNLISLILFGGLVKNQHVKTTDMIQIMIVVQEVNQTVLDQIGGSIRGNKRSNQFRPLIMSQDDLTSSMDVFPIKFLDLQQSYQVLRGEDVIQGIKIDRKHLQLRCEQQIKDLMLNIRSWYVSASPDADAYSRILLRTFYAFILPLDTLVELKTGNVYRQENEIINAADGIGLDMSSMKRIQEHRQGDHFASHEEQKKTYLALMKTLEKAAKLADEL